jgi:butyrate kinase
VSEKYAILTVNPGSTSTKLDLFHGLDPIDEFEVNRQSKIGLRGAGLPDF